MAAKARKTTARPPKSQLAAATRKARRGGPRAATTRKATPASESAALDAVAERLAHTEAALQDALARLPRPEDFEPLLRPLTEFARVAPALAESLGELVRLTRPLAESATSLEQLVRSLRLPQARPIGAPAAQPVEAAADLDRLLGQVAETLASVQLEIRSALAQLPRDPAYARVAAQLRELASASPSLLEWLREVPPLAQPLSAAVAGLAEGAERLARSEQSLRQARAGLRGGS